MSVIVGAYAASPAFRDWNPALESEFLRALAALDGVRGFELPWLGSLHPHDDAWLLSSIPEGTDAVLTGIPHVARRAGAEAAYGLASTDADGRRAALNDIARMRDDAARLDDAGRARVVAIELHTAPRAASGSVDALAGSLAEIAAWNWGAAQLVIEHCDAAVPGQEFEKGFLTLQQELDAITATGAPIGVWLNWGRSAIELHDADAVAGQVEQAAASGLLRGLAFSGASSEPGPFGGPWTDAHLPIASDDADDSRSLLTPARVEAAVRAAGPIPFTALKVSRRTHESQIEQIVAGIAAQLAIVETANTVAA